MNANLTKKFALLAVVFGLFLSAPTRAQQNQNDAKPTGVPVLWKDPGNIQSRNFQYGPGSTELAPVAPFTYVAEDSTGESPKFRVTDARGDTWVVKLGVEAQAETVAVRLIWAMGYFADEAYYFDRVAIKNLPNLSRGQLQKRQLLTTNN